MEKNNALLKSKYADLTDDFAFKKVFATEEDKDLLICLLNTFLKRKLAHPITDVAIQNPYIQGQTKGNRDANLDIRCQDSEGKKFIVEMQIGRQKHFIKRALYYSSLAIANSGKKGKEWDFNYPNVYSLNFLDFPLDFGEDNDDIVQYISHSNEEHPEIRYDYENLVFVRLTEFKKSLSECKSLQDKLIFTLCHAHKLKTRPKQFRERFFGRLFELAKIANFTIDERSRYEENAMKQVDINASIITAREDGWDKCMEKVEKVFTLMERGLPLAEARKRLGIEKLSRKHKN